MKDYRGTVLAEGDKVAIYWGYNSLQTAVIHKIKVNQAKVKVTYKSGEEVISTWKRGECMIKLEDTL